MIEGYRGVAALMAVTTATTLSLHACQGADRPEAGVPCVGAGHRS